MNFKKLNNITGWVICIIACFVYISTAEAGGSLWDCGEFVSCAYKLQIPHPPGAPLFVLLGRFFIILFGDNPKNAAYAVNIMSAVASGFTILFLFWTITHFARRIAGVAANAVLNGYQAFAVMGAGVVGALAYTFSDSFWFSAVEGEVYALSSFFTAIVFWAILKWETALDESDAESRTHFNPDRWLIFIFFMMGLSIGVHLLNLLAIPAIVMVYYIRKHKDFNIVAIKKWFTILTIVGGALAMAGAAYASAQEAAVLEPYAQYVGNVSSSTLTGLFLVGTLVAIGILYAIKSFAPTDKKDYYIGMYIFFVIGCVLTGFTQVAIIQYSIKFAGAFDRIFVNSFGLPFFVGFAAFFVLLAVAIWLGLNYAAKKGWAYLRLALWSITFVLIGYSTYVTTMIRSNADPAVDMYNVDNPVSLVGYLGRDQYGDFPLLYGQKFTARPVATMDKGVKYRKTDKAYEEAGKDSRYVFLPKDKMAFPRLWDISNETRHADYYAYYLGIGKMQDKQTGEEKYDDNDGERPSQADNISYFMGYQFNFMYLRYFLWNFAGKQNDIQGLFNGNPRDGNFKTGIGFVDNMFLGDQSLMPDSMKNNKANNNLYALPLILGIIGLVYQTKRKGGDAFVSFLLFFFTGFAIVIYLNQPGYQPRERDYAYVGSFYAFAIWIGLGVMAVATWLNKFVKGTTPAIAATALCFVAVPTVMAQQEWDDHDRSKKTMARDLAIDYLESCPKNAILFSFGDNDTYPLWYAQEVEGIRPDIRVINYSLLGIDWYINQLRYKVNDSDPADVIFTPDQIAGGKRDYITFKQNAAYNDNSFYNLYDVLKNHVGKDDHDKIENRGNDGDYINTYPTHKMFVPVNKAAFANDKTVNPAWLPDTLKFEIRKNNIYKNELAILAIIATNNWKRPICFTSNYDLESLGLANYLRKEGVSYRLVPAVDEEVIRMSGMNIDVETSKNLFINKFAYGNAQNKNVYFDEENRRHLINNLRLSYVQVAKIMAIKGNATDAVKLLDLAHKNINSDNLPYAMFSRGNAHSQIGFEFLQACFLAKHKTLFEKIYPDFKKELIQQKKYYESLNGYKADNLAGDLEGVNKMMSDLENLYKAYTEQVKNATDADAAKIPVLPPR